MDTINSFRGKNYFLSNFSLNPVEYDGVTWPTSEHAYQAAKTHDKDKKTMIQLCDSPGLSKKAGKKLTLRADWHEVRVRIMNEIVRSKFANNPTLTRKLLATGDASLSEANSWHDNFWGNCTCGRSACDYSGYNHLGRILMGVREELRDAENEREVPDSSQASPE